MKLGDILYAFFKICFIYFLINLEWVEEPVSSANVLKLIYQGRFLHGSVSVGGNQTLIVYGRFGS